MPFAPEDYSADDQAQTFRGIDLSPKLEGPEANGRPAPDYTETAGAAFRMDSDVVSPFSDLTRGIDFERPDDDFDLIASMKGTKYEGNLAFAGVRNREAFDAVTAQLDREAEDRQTIEDAGWTGTFFDVLAGATSWTNILPGGIGFKAAKGGLGLAKAGLSVGTAAAVGATASEATLQASQLSRSTQDSLSNIGGAFLLGSALGGAAYGLTAKNWRGLTKQAEDFLQSREEPESAATASDGAPASGGGFGAASASAAAVERGPSRLKDEGLFRSLKGLNRQDPIIRTQLNELTEPKNIIRDLTESPLELEANRQGFATSDGGTVETRIKFWNAPLAQSIGTLDDAYARYFFGDGVGRVKASTAKLRGEIGKVRGTSDKMTFREFKEEVGRAMSRDDMHDIPEVQEAAAAARTVFERGKRLAIEAGVHDKSLADAPSAGYLHRLYNKEKIRGQRPEFKARIVDYLEDGRLRAERREAETEAARVAVQIDEQSKRVDGLRKRMTAGTRRLDRQEGAVARSNADVRAAQARRVGLRRAAVASADRTASQPLRDAIRRAKSGKTLALPKTPVLDILKARGGVVRGSTLAQELQARGITPKSRPDLFRKSRSDGAMFGGEARGAADNLVGSEHPVLADNLPVDENGYVSEGDILSAIDDELGGSPLRTAAERDRIAAVDGPANALREELDSLGLSMDLPEDDIVRELARAETEAGRFASFDDIPMVEVPEALEADIEGVEDFYVRQTRGELETRYAEMRADIAKRGEAAALADPRFAQRYQDVGKQIGRLKDAGEAKRFARTVMRRDYAARAAAFDAETRKLDDLVAQFDAMPDDVRIARRVSIARDYATISRDLSAKKAEEARLIKRREEHAAVRNEPEIHEIDGRLRIVEADIGKIEGRHAKLKDIVERTGKGTQAEIDELREFIGLGRGDLEGIADDVIDTILGHADGRMVLPNAVVGPRGALKARTLRIDDARIEDFLERDIEMVMRAYTRSMSADVELASKFGSVDLAEPIRKINDEANARIARVSTPAERIRIDNSRKAAVRDIEAIRDRMRGTYGMPSNPDGIGVRAARLVRHVNYTRLLGGSVLSSLSDPAKVVFNYGLGSVFKDGFLPMVRNLRNIRMAGEEARLAGTAMEMVLDSRAMSYADVMDEHGRASRFERFVEGASSRFGMVSLLAPWTDAVKQFAGLVVMNNFLRAAEEVAAGTASAKTVGRLGAANISADAARKVAAQFREHGITTDGLRQANTSAWTDRSAVEAFRAMMVREVDRTIVSVGQDKPLWMSTEIGKLIGQFKSFGVASVQKTLFAGLQQRDMATLNGTVMMLGLGALSYYAIEKARGNDVSDDWKVWAGNAVDKSGILGWIMDVNGFAEKATAGRVGLSAFTGKEIARYESRNVLGALLGPSADIVGDAALVTASAFSGQSSGADVHRIRKLVPFQNLFYLRGLFDKAEDGFSDAFGLKPRRQAMN